MSAYAEWQMALKRGDKEQAEESKREFFDECRRDYERDRDYYKS